MFNTSQWLEMFALFMCTNHVSVWSCRRVLSRASFLYLFTNCCVFSWCSNLFVCDEKKCVCSEYSARCVRFQFIKIRRIPTKSKKYDLSSLIDSCVWFVYVHVFSLSQKTWTVWSRAIFLLWFDKSIDQWNGSPLAQRPPVFAGYVLVRAGIFRCLVFPYLSLCPCIQPSPSGAALSVTRVVWETRGWSCFAIGGLLFAR